MYLLRVIIQFITALLQLPALITDKLHLSSLSSEQVRQHTQGVARLLLSVNPRGMIFFSTFPRQASSF